MGEFLASFKECGKKGNSPLNVEIGFLLNGKRI
jgi:hypothetical protein